LFSFGISFFFKSVPISGSAVFFLFSDRIFRVGSRETLCGVGPVDLDDPPDPPASGSRLLYCHSIDAIPAAGGKHSSTISARTFFSENTAVPALVRPPFSC